MLQRRKFLLGLGLVPAIIKTPNILMPIKSIKTISIGQIWAEYQIQQINKFSDLDKAIFRQFEIIMVRYSKPSQFLIKYGIAHN